MASAQVLERGPVGTASVPGQVGALPLEGGPLGQAFSRGALQERHNARHLAASEIRTTTLAGTAQALDCSRQYHGGGPSRGDSKRGPRREENERQAVRSLRRALGERGVRDNGPSNSGLACRRRDPCDCANTFSEPCAFFSAPVNSAASPNDHLRPDATADKHKFDRIGGGSLG
jgi:hypothetical protein